MYNYNKRLQNIQVKKIRETKDKGLTCFLDGKNKVRKKECTSHTLKLIHQRTNYHIGKVYQVHCILCLKQFYTNVKGNMLRHFCRVHVKRQLKISGTQILFCKCCEVPNRGTDQSSQNSHYHCLICHKPCDTGGTWVFRLRCWMFVLKCWCDIHYKVISEGLVIHYMLSKKF